MAPTRDNAGKLRQSARFILVCGDSASYVYATHFHCLVFLRILPFAFTPLLILLLLPLKHYAHFSFMPRYQQPIVQNLFSVNY
jgi:hypothetical protein